ncbi:hypothetical protein [Scytonema millei]|uniref:hypothetical protein n=1 Tax=Scytonema millei TaxID=1245922 RepID=UPI0013F48B0B|nr:hypothetical protein [Scytonema millei]
MRREVRRKRREVRRKRQKARTQLIPTPDSYGIQHSAVVVGVNDNGGNTNTK